MLRLRPIKFLVLAAILLLYGCAAKNARTPMDDEPIFSTNELRIGVFTYNAQWDRSGLLACGDSYPNVSILDEVDVGEILRSRSLVAQDLLNWGDDFESFKDLPGFHLLILAFEREGRTYLRMVNYLGRYASTVALDSGSPSCADFLRSQRLVVIESIPPLADISLGGRPIGEAPLWTWLRDGRYEIKCELPNQIFSPLKLDVPKMMRGVCHRQNTDAGGDQSMLKADEDHEGAWEGAFLYLLLGAVAIGGAILPFLLLF